MKISRNVVDYLFCPGAFDQLSEVLKARKSFDSGKALIFVDHFFENQEGFLKGRIDADKDVVFYVNTTDEPSTDLVDKLFKDAKNFFPNYPSAIVGIGGGSTLDIAKAVSNLFTNGGKAEDYQGWDLVQKKGVYKIGVPTISGTGAESSRTCVMMNYKKNLKLGMNSSHSVYEMLLLDPQLCETVPNNQYFYTGLDTYIHCVESLAGKYRNAIGDAFSREALRLCEEVFLNSDMKALSSREKLMVASYLGGCAIANSFVGLVHPFSAGLSMVLGLHHCVSNCIVMNVMEDYYPKEVLLFREMLKKQKVTIPLHVTKNMKSDDFSRLYEATIIHEKPLANAVGPNFKEVLTPQKVREIFERM